MLLRSARTWFALTLGVLPALASVAQAGDISWSGLYRFEGVQTHNLELGGADQEKAYALHHLILRPQIVAADGLLIRSRFDVFNAGAYPNSQVGQFLGSGPRGTAPAPYNQSTSTSSAQNSNVLTNVQASDTIAVNELYLTWVNEFGSLVVGRAPLQFGLGMSYSAGNGEFDHWFDNRDMVGYKMVFGNMFIMPMYGKVHEGMQSTPYDDGTGGDLGAYDDVTDLMFHLSYDNIETQTKMGVFYRQRSAGGNGSDAPAGVNVNNSLGGDKGVNRGDSPYKLTQWNLFLERGWGDFKIGTEAGFTNGQLGVRVADSPNAVEVATSGFGIATELSYAPQTSRYSYALKMGIATGDDGGSNDKFEGFFFNRNYQVAELMFNHLLGNEDFLRTQSLRGGYIKSSNRALTGSQVVDVEALSNAFYIAPSVSRKISDKWVVDGTLTYARLQANPLPDTITEKDLGWELDLAGTYKPYDRFTWRTGAAVLIPGSAFSGGSRGYDHNFAWGLTTKAAIRF